MRIRSTWSRPAIVCISGQELPISCSITRPTWNTWRSSARPISRRSTWPARFRCPNPTLGRHRRPHSRGVARGASNATGLPLFIATLADTEALYARDGGHSEFHDGGHSEFHDGGHSEFHDGGHSEFNVEFVDRLRLLLGGGEPFLHIRP